MNGLADIKELQDVLEQDDRHLQEAIRRRARADFEFFFNTIFRESIEEVEGGFKEGQHMNEWARRLQTNKRTATVAARKHLKTTVFLAYMAWLLFRVGNVQGSIFEVLYMSYSDGMASEKIKLLKNYISANQYFSGITDMKPTADTILEYRVGSKIYQAKAAGIFSATRGTHPRVVIVDDPLKDPEQELNIATIEKVTKHFFRKIASLPKEGMGELHVGGTPQDTNDLFGQLREKKGYDYREYPAIINYKTKHVLWPEQFPYERLIDIRDNEVGPNAFEPEYQCQPRRTTEGYLKKDNIQARIDPNLKPLDPQDEDVMDKIEGTVVAGMDIGKKQHPSHIAAYDVTEEEDAEGEPITCLKQIMSKWLDGWDYTEQIDLCREIVEAFGIETFKYDSTRSEFDSFEEKGELPDGMEGMKFTRASKFKVAAALDKAINSGKKIKITLLDDPRQTRQMENVDNDLQSISSKDGHGDSFWSNAMAVEAALETGPQVREI